MFSSLTRSFRSCPRVSILPHRFYHIMGLCYCIWPCSTLHSSITKRSVSPTPVHLFPYDQSSHMSSSLLQNCPVLLNGSPPSKPALSASQAFLHPSPLYFPSPQSLNLYGQCPQNGHFPNPTCLGAKITVDNALGLVVSITNFFFFWNVKVIKASTVTVNFICQKLC